ncbi:hypothetical protein BKA58DRAFT_60767 [Alternaria rosae]|uniref:uncharacterized protein n=1 Tax=Alternaria rosae TaxID=1187941 RepID=UPI001E8D1749|nr:uncharacterized protein BKA58DRAFT_60767 [Alternaria rosae]KAH6852854.1 hypothetical protein BKA58DRAFT_60767 [Alternaria rosae]
MARAELKGDVQRGFASLPSELFLNILDQLVGTHNGQQPVAYAPSNTITKTLRALTLVSRNTYLIATQYLYSHCLYLDSCTTCARFRRTLGLNLGRHPQALNYGEAGRNEGLFAEAQALRHITSIFVSPTEVRRLIEGNHTPLVRLPQIIDLCNMIGPSLKRLALDLSAIYAPPSEVEQIRPHVTENRVFSHMMHLEELIVSYDVVNYFRHPPPNLKRLAITTQEMTDLEIAFCLKTPSLQTLVMMRPFNLAAKDIDTLFRSYDGRSLDVVLVDVNSNHRTPEKTRNWTGQDAVRIWEADVPISFYGDDDDIILCDAWIWNHGVGGTLWSQDRRRMASWEDVEKRLAGPVHTFVEV